MNIKLTIIKKQETSKCVYMKETFKIFIERKLNVYWRFKSHFDLDCLNMLMILNFYMINNTSYWLCKHW